MNDDAASDDVDADTDGGASVDGAAGRPCPACGAQMYRRHCKYVCPGHGVVYDCSDPFYG
ncbi:MAG: HVO_2523 family zinc finger protein [Halolamina sp.]